MQFTEHLVIQKGVDEEGAFVNLIYNANTGKLIHISSFAFFQIPEL